MTVPQTFLYPNPTNGLVNIKIDTELNNGELVLLNCFGQKVHEQKIIQGTNEINIKSISSGLYNYIIFENGQAIGNGKLTKE